MHRQPPSLSLSPLGHYTYVIKEMKFSEDGLTLTGRWVFPNGGYEFIATKIA